MIYTWYVEIKDKDPISVSTSGLTSSEHTLFDSFHLQTVAKMFELTRDAVTSGNNKEQTLEYLEKLFGEFPSDALIVVEHLCRLCREEPWNCYCPNEGLFMDEDLKPSTYRTKKQ